MEATGSSDSNIYRHLLAMKQLIDLDNLKLYLRAENLLTDNDMSRLEVLPPHNTRDKAIHTLATIIQQKGPSGLTRFMNALRRSADEDQQSGHNDLYQILSKDVPLHPSGTSVEETTGEARVSHLHPEPVRHAQPIEHKVPLKPQVSEPGDNLDLSADQDKIEKECGANLLTLLAPALEALPVLMLFLGVLQFLVGIGGVLQLEWKPLQCTAPGNMVIKLFNVFNGAFLFRAGYFTSVGKLWTSKQYCLWYIRRAWLRKCLFGLRLVLNITGRLSLYLVLFANVVFFVMTSLVIGYLHIFDSDGSTMCGSFTYNLAFFFVAVYFAIPVLSFVLSLVRTACRRIVAIYKTARREEEELLKVP